MRALLDTNILIHREASRVVNEEIGVLFNWLDRLSYEKCIHPLSVNELAKHSDQEVVRTMHAKLRHYNTLKTEAPETPEIEEIRSKFDRNENDGIDTSLLKELLHRRVDCLITEDRKIHVKAVELGIEDDVFTIDDFLEKVIAENPTLSEYKVLAVKKEYFGNINLDDPFFDSFKEDYSEFSDWFNRKADEEAYICQSDTGSILAFLYVKKEGREERYDDIQPAFPSRKRLKVGTLKVSSNGYKLGERFLKIIFDNALRNHVDEIYVTLFDSREEHARLIGLLEDWGFEFYGNKLTHNGEEKVYVRNFRPEVNPDNPKFSYPFISKGQRVFIVPIYPEYHTELLPDSILNNESPHDFVENEPYRNAIQKVYICRSFVRDLISGDIILFYRTGGYHKSVLTTIGIVDSVVDHISSADEFIKLCRKRSVFTDSELREHWNYKPRNRPFIVNFLYLYSLPKRPNLKVLIDYGIIDDINSAPRGFEQISSEQFETVLRISKSDESFIID